MRKKASDAAWLKALQIICLLWACSAGADYLMDPPISALYVVETLTPRPPSGVVFLFLGIMGLVGEWWRELGSRRIVFEAPPYWVCRRENRWWPSWVAHSGLAAIYFALLVTCIGEMILNHHLYGLRVAFAMLSFCGAHLYFAQKYRYVS